MNKQIALTIVKKGIDWLMRMIDKDGRFIYSYYYDKPHRPINDYNILRHAGCCYALFESANYFKDDTIRYMAECATEYLLNNHCFYVNNMTNKKEMYIIENNIIKTGGLGLTLLALLSIDNKMTYLEEAEQIGKYILSIQNKDGSLQFQKKRFNNSVQDSKNKILKSNCDFYDGEVALGLLKLYEITGKKLYYNSALALIKNKYLKSKKGGWTRDHWMVQAIELINKPLVMHDEFAWNSIYRIINDPINLYNQDITGSIGCRTEALFSHANILQKQINQYKGKEIQKSFIEQQRYVLDTADKFLDMQAKGQLQYGLSMGAWRQNLKSKLLRIDFNQHNICAFLKYLKWNK